MRGPAACSMYHFVCLVFVHFRRFGIHWNISTCKLFEIGRAYFGERVVTWWGEVNICYDKIPSCCYQITSTCVNTVTHNSSFVNLLAATCFGFESNHKPFINFDTGKIIYCMRRKEISFLHYKYLWNTTHRQPWNACQYNHLRWRLKWNWLARQ
jgi:hypothetical protein